MSPSDARKLLGGYATGTLTPEERQQLFQAALADQSLFDELAQEQPLKEIFDDPARRAEMLDAASGSGVTHSRWLTWVIPSLAAAAFGAIAIMIVAHKPAVAPVIVAKVEHRSARFDAAPVAEAASNEVSIARLKKEAPSRPSKPTGLHMEAPAPQQPPPPAPASTNAAAPAAPASGFGGGPSQAIQQAQQSAPKFSTFRSADEAGAGAAGAAQSKTELQQKMAESVAIQGAAANIMAVDRARALFENTTAPALRPSAISARMAVAPALGLHYSSLGSGGLASLRLESNVAGHIYAFRHDKEQWISILAADVTAHQPVTANASSANEILVILSRAPIAPLDSAAVDRLKSTAKVPLVSSPGYIVDSSPASDDILVATIPLGSR